MRSDVQPTETLHRGSQKSAWDRVATGKGNGSSLHMDIKEEAGSHTQVMCISEAWDRRLGVTELAIRIRLFLRGSKGQIKSIQRAFIEHLLQCRLWVRTANIK